MEEQIHNELWDRENRESVKIIAKKGLKINGQKVPDPKLHQIISFVKSGIRIVSCIAGLCGYFGIGFFGLLLAEIVGIYEELV